MKILSLISITFLLFFACTQEKVNTNTSKHDLSAFPKHIQQKIENIQYLDTANFAKVGAVINAISKEKFGETSSSEHKILAEKFCKNSKGYQSGIWEGQNDCSWAVEKYQLERFGDLVTRTADTLAIKLKNGEKIEFTHDRSNPDQTLYYQFKNYLQNADFFVVEAIQKNKCRVSNLINANDGSSYPINGTVYFSKDQNSFLSASFSNELPFSCTNKIELYKISNAQIEKIWHIPTGDWGVTEAKFINNMEFLMEQSTTGIPSEYKRYAKVASIH